MDRNAKYLPEIDDGAAPAEVDAVYSEIKRLWGVDSPALFFRTLATIPNGLTLCWDVLEPFAASGRLQREANAIAAHTSVGLDARRLASKEIESAAFTVEQRAHILNALASYNRANPMNLMAAATLDACGACDVSRPRVLPVAGWVPEPPLYLSTPMLEPSAIAPDAQDAIKALSAVAVGKDTVGGQAVLMPSLYRHLAYFPQFLRFAAEVVHAQDNRGHLSELIASVREEALGRANALRAEALARAERVPFPVEVQEIIQRFTRKIPEMVVMGRFLRGLLNDS